MTVFGRPLVKRYALWSLSDRCLSYLSVLSVTLVYCGQTVGWIKMKLGMQVGLGHGQIVLDGDPAPPPQRDTAPNFRPICCGQMAGWIKMPLGTKVGLGPGYLVLRGDPAPLSKRERSLIPNFRPMSIVGKRLDGSRWHLARRWAMVHLPTFYLIPNFTKIHRWA